MGAGHTVIRLPPYHWELNPVELAWAAEKNFVAKENSEMKPDSVEKLFRKKRNNLPRELWANCVVVFFFFLLIIKRAYKD